MTQLDHEPAIAADDTQPRPALAVTDTQPDEGRRGCRNPLLVFTITFAMIGFFVITVALSGLLGWRDGTVARKTQDTVALIGTVNRQATNAYSDLGNQQYQIAEDRCKYIVTLKPFYPGARECMSTAEAMLSATPMPTITPTSMATATTTPTPTKAVDASSPKQLFDQAQIAFRGEDYETAMKWLEALRGKDSSYQQTAVEDMLVKTYMALADKYKNSGQLSAMVIVLEKAQQIVAPKSLDDPWPFTLNATELYLDGKGYLDAQNYAQADKTFRLLMQQTTTYLDTKVLACQAFGKAGDSDALAKYKC